MTLPTDYCAQCGEYVAERLVPAPTYSEPWSVVSRLTHVSPDGAIIDRAHNARLAPGATP